MGKTVWRWIKRHPKKAGGVLLTVVVLLLNVSAFLHAYAMTHYVQGGQRTDKPEALSPLEKAKVLLVGVRIPRPVCDASPSDIGLEHEVHRLVAVDGTECEGWSIAAHDSKGLCLLFPGYAEAKSGLLDEARVLCESGYDCFLVDFRGCGNSSGSSTAVGYLEAAEVAAAVGYARQNLSADGPLFLYGRSMGSAAVLRAIAELDVDVDGIILESPFDRLLSTVENRFAAMGLPAFPSARLLIFWGGVQRGFWAFSHNPADYAKQVRCPVLLLYGTADPRVTLDQVQSVFNNLGGEKRLMPIAGAGHESLLNAAPQLWEEGMARFLQEHARRDQVQ